MSAASQRWVRKLGSFAEERQADQEFWRQLDPAERVNAVEELRRDWWKIRGQTEERLRRTVRVFRAARR
jgi:Txe/YoeB family toxin of Txe-Axe toxin-antitoxin module